MFLDGRHTRGRLALCAMLVAPACSEDAQSPDERGIALYVDAYCQIAFDCDCAETTWASEEACRERTHRTLRGPHLSARAAGLTYDEDCLNVHIENIERTACDGFNRQWCAYFHGDKAEGEACTNHHSAGSGFNDCAQGLVCFGRCYDLDNPDPAFLLEAGETCLELGKGALGLCAEGLRCHPETFRCAPVAVLGDACTTSLQCAESYCDGGVCVPRKVDGEPCTEPYECRSGICDESVCIEADAPICQGAVY